MSLVTSLQTRQKALIFDNAGRRMSHGFNWWRYKQRRLTHSTYGLSIRGFLEVVDLNGAACSGWHSEDWSQFAVSGRPDFTGSIFALLEYYDFPESPPDPDFPTSLTSVS
jgi:hypothetical protein